jgi:hypothetical protein
MGSQRSEDRYETGARKLESRPDEVDRDKVGLDAAGNRSHGLMQRPDEVPEQTRQSDAGPRHAKVAKGTARPSNGPFRKDR